MNNQAPKKIFWNLSLRLELFTSFIPIPTFVYFIVVVGAFKTEDDLKAVQSQDLYWVLYGNMGTTLSLFQN